MGLSTLIVMIAVGYTFLLWYVNNSKRDQILCYFRRPNKTKVKKFVKMSSRHVIFGKSKYDIVPSRIEWEWYRFFYFMPIWVPTLDYTEGKRLPLDPNKMNYDWDNPENRKTINASELMRSYFSTQNPAGAKQKTGIIMQYLPWVAIGLVVVVYFLLDNKMQGFGHQLDAVVGTLNAIAK